MPVAQVLHEPGGVPVKTGSAARQRAFRKNNPVAARAAKKRYMAARGWLIEKHRHLFERYQITPEQYDRMLLNQNNLCLICGKPFSDEKKTGAKFGPLQPVIDHHHASGYIRGILHRQCNSALGAFGDSPELLRDAADYLDAWKESECR